MRRLMKRLEVILPVPYYFNHLMWLQMQGIEPVYLRFAFANVDSQRFEEMVDRLVQSQRNA